MSERLRTSVVDAVRGVRWYLRQVTGEAKWDEYVASCAAAGTPAMTRREFERHRDHHREASARSSCC